MKAGRELDALVAEKVMGWHHIEKEGYHWMQGRLPGQPANFVPTPVRPYSTDIAAAWVVLEKLVEDGCQVQLSAHQKPFLYWCEIYRAKHPSWLDPKAKSIDTSKRKRHGKDDFKVWASYVKSMPLAICLAALKLTERVEALQTMVANQPVPCPHKNRMALPKTELVHQDQGRDSMLYIWCPDCCSTIMYPRGAAGWSKPMEVHGE